MSWYVEGFAERSGIQVALEIAEDLGSCPARRKPRCFRVIQQSLANIHRHSGSSAARIALDSSGDRVTLEISDSGTGIAAATLAEFHSGARLAGVGMVGMRERIQNLMDSFTFVPATSGTCIEISLPLPAAAQSASAY